MNFNFLEWLLISSSVVAVVAIVQPIHASCGDAEWIILAHGLTQNTLNVTGWRCRVGIPMPSACEAVK